MALIRDWHRLNRMPPRATCQQPIKWHAAHAHVCGCRANPGSIKPDVEKLLRARNG